jgi:hypothetical protein
MLITSAFAQQTPNPSNADIAAQLQKLTGKNSKQALGQVVVIGSLLGCTQKAAGKEATNRFYHRMKAIGDQAEDYCRAGNATEARALMLSTFNEQKSDPVAQAALGCYDTQKQTVDAIGGRKMAADVANYARWLRDPKLAQAEMEESDICRNQPRIAKKAAL